MNKNIAMLTVLLTAGMTANAQHTHTAQADSAYNSMTHTTHGLQEVTVTAKSGMRRMGGAVNGVTIGQAELFRAACCNLGESFVTNPSVDVSYTDAATGAKQIKLLGLSGTYVQMLTENMPNFRGAALPYSLGYVPGPWMKSIQVSKGSSSVKNGYESMTGQINVEYLKPEDEQAVDINLYGDTKTRAEANLSANWHLAPRLSTVLMGHMENTFEEHDENHDGFYDKPKVRQLNLMNRWFWQEGNYIFHGGASLIHEKRTGGQTDHDTDLPADHRYQTGIEADRYEGYMKHAFILDPDHATNLALMASASMQQLGAAYGHKHYAVNEKNVYASLILETDLTPMHNLSAGLSLNYDYLGQHAHDNTLTLNGTAAPDKWRERETVPGAYARYTFNLHHTLTAMAGLRVDHSSVFGTFWTPRFHVKYQPIDLLSVRLSAGKGYRTVHALAENNNLMASGRRLVIDPLNQEHAWNYGASLAMNIPMAGKTLKLNAEYYYTRFGNQAVIDYDTDPDAIHIGNLQGRSYSHTMQVDATYPVFSGFTLTAAYRLNDVKTTYGGQLMEHPLTSKYKGLVTAQYKTPMELWQIDVTLQLNGGGRMPAPRTLANGTSAWNGRFKAFEQLSVQITRDFRHFSAYIGGENLTGFKQQNAIIGAANPWSADFEPTLVWGPMHGRMFYAGIRAKI